MSCRRVAPSMGLDSFERCLTRGPIEMGLSLKLQNRPAADGVSSLAAPAAAVLPLLVDAVGVSCAIVVAVDAAGLRVIAGAGSCRTTPRRGQTWSLPDPLWSALTQAEQLQIAASSAVSRRSPMVIDMAADEVAVASLQLDDDAHDHPIAAIVAAIDPGLSGSGAHEALGRAAKVLVSLWRLEREVAESKAQLADLTALASTDPLTGLANRRVLSERLTAEEHRCRRSGGSAGILGLDVDDLKGHNDRFGHAAGDEIIRQVASSLRQATRAGDLVARTGGDEL